MTPPFVLEPSWQQALDDELKKPYMAPLAAFVAEERAGPVPIYPPKHLVFNAFQKTPFDQVKVVIVGQDPYHGPGQAHGLSFSVPKGIPPPPSLKNIFKEIQSDLGIPPPDHGCLLKWAEQGVLLLNNTLTVRQGQPLSHHKRGWERFTDAVIAKINEREEEPVVFLLWGRSAKDKCPHIHSRHKVLKAAHPSPLSAYNGFFGCKHFSQANDFLKGKEINWNLN